MTKPSKADQQAREGGEQQAGAQGDSGKPASPQLPAALMEHHRRIVAALLERLERARLELEHAAAGKDLAAQRRAIAESLTALLDYSHELGVRPAQVRPLRVLLGALADVDAGRSNPLLKPEHATGAPQMARQRAMDLALACACVTLLIRPYGNMRLADACALVSRVLRRRGVEMSATGLKNWRRALLAGRQPVEAREFYDRMIKQHKDAPHAADSLLHALESVSGASPENKVR